MVGSRHEENGVLLASMCKVPRRGARVNRDELATAKAWRVTDVERIVPESGGLEGRQMEVPVSMSSQSARPLAMTRFSVRPSVSTCSSQADLCASVPGLRRLYFSPGFFSKELLASFADSRALLWVRGAR